MEALKVYAWTIGLVVKGFGVVFNVLGGGLGWLVGLGIRGGALALDRGRSTYKGLPSATSPTLQCPRGCPPQAADGWWECASCQGRFMGWVWDECPACGSLAGYVPCDTCGHVIPNPHVR